MTLRLGGKKRGQGHQKEFGGKGMCLPLGDRGAGRGCVRNEATGNWGTKMYGGLNWPSALVRVCHFFSDQGEEGECCASSGAEGYRQMEVGGQGEVRKPRLAGSTGLWTAHECRSSLDAAATVSSFSSSRPRQASEHFLLQS